MILMAVADAFCRFTWVNVGARGSANDSTIFQFTTFGTRVVEGKLPLPPPRQIYPDFDAKIPYLLVSDEAFPGKVNLMKPYPGSRVDDLSEWQ